MRGRLALAAIASLVLARQAVAQDQTTCTMVQLPDSRVSLIKLPSGESNIFVGGGLVVRCPSRHITLKADSAEIYGDEKRDFLVGHVDYDEPRLALTSDYLTYYTADERIVAAGNVHGRLPSGSTLVGPLVDYRRAVPRIRTRPLTLATGRPTVTIIQRDTSGKDQPPINVVANTIFMDGDSLIYGSGSVQIARPEINSTSDSAFINTGNENMQLMRNPILNGTRGRQFRLVGERIDLFSSNRKLQRVVSRGRAQANSQDFTLRADTIDLRIIADQLEHAYAWGAGRAHARSSTQNITADSLDVHMPGQRVREVHALRKAFAEGKPDTMKFRADTTDWLRGDTIVAYFDTLAPPDTTKGPAIHKLISLDSAEAYYHVAPSDTTSHRYAINYVSGRTITVDFDEQRVASIVVEDKVQGIYLEPAIVDTTKAKANARPGANRPPTRRPVRPTPGVRRP